MTFEGKVVAVTGAGGGIGTAIVSKFVDLGAKAVLLDVKEEFAKRTADLLHLTEENSMCLGVDVSKEEDVKEAVSKIRTRFNRVDVLVNTAGIPGPSARTEDYSFEYKKSIRSECVWDFSDDAKYTSDHAGTKKWCNYQFWICIRNVWVSI